MESYEKKQLIYKFILALVFVVCITTIITFYATVTNLKNGIKFGFEEEISESEEEDIDSISRKLKNFRKIIDAHYIGEVDANVRVI